MPCFPFPQACQGPQGLCDLPAGGALVELGHPAALGLQLGLGKASHRLGRRFPGRGFPLALGLVEVPVLQQPLGPQLQRRAADHLKALWGGEVSLAAVLPVVEVVAQHAGQVDGDALPGLAAAVHLKAKAGDEEIPQPLRQGQEGPVVDVVLPVGIQQRPHHIVPRQGPKAQGGKALPIGEAEEAGLHAAAL